MSLPELQQNPLVQRVIDIFDTDGNGEVDFKGKNQSTLLTLEYVTCEWLHSRVKQLQVAVNFLQIFVKHFGFLEYVIIEEAIYANTAKEKKALPKCIRFDAVNDL